MKAALTANIDITERVRGLLESPSLFLRDVEPLARRCILSPMSEASYRQSSFLDDRIVRDGNADFAVSLDGLLQRVEAEQAGMPTINYLFHVGHCGSTLISRCLGDLPAFFALREPPLLMGLARSARRLNEPGFPIDSQYWQELRSLALAMLARTWRDGQVALVKPTSHANNLIPQLMSVSGRERAILLYVDIETYLTTMLRDTVRRETRLFARDFRLKEFLALHQEAGATPTDMSDAMLTAMTWLLHAREFALVLDDPAIASRCRLVHFDEFLADPRCTLVALAEFLQDNSSALSASDLDFALQWMSLSAKRPKARFGPSQRQAMLATSRRAHATEIEASLSWARSVCESRPFAGLVGRFAEVGP